jgi:hypothetical protein
MKKITHENFVGVYEEYFSAQFCDNLVEYFEWCNKNNKTFSRPEREAVKKDDSVCLNPICAEEINFSFPNIQNYLEEFNDTFWNVCHKDYFEKYSVLADYDRHTIFTYKVQKTDPAGGYHIWHCEDGAKNFSERVGVYILYLNDVEEGGETEFLYFSKRIKPKKGTLLIFPPNYPWAHRGNPPLSGTKYIMTGWLEFA